MPLDVATYTPIIIYGVCDPRTTELRYIGKTKYPLRARIRGHVLRSLRIKDSYSAHWFRSLVLAGVEPDAFVLEEVTVDTWQEAERFWIEYYRTLGARLVNGTNGGDGMVGTTDTPEVRLKKSIGNKGKPKAPEHRAIFLKTAFKPGHKTWNIGKKYSEETRKKIGDAQRGKPKRKWTEETRTSFKEKIKNRKKAKYPGGWGPGGRIKRAA